MTQKPDLLSMLPEEIEEYLKTLGEPRFRAKQIFKWLHSGTPFSEMSNLPAALRKRLSEETEYRLPTVERKQESRLDGTVKYLFRLLDGEYIESVLMRYKHGNTLCISSQVGCRMGCRFCASTIGGKVRDLLPSEMLGQVVAAASDSGERVSNVVLMGIGEPLDNYDNVLKFLRLVNHADGICIGYRHISLSTSGIVPKILALADEDIPLTLSVSLHAPTDEKRSAIMPVNKKWGVATLLSACRAYYEKSGRRISFEYTLLSGENDSPDDATLLATTLRNAFRGTDAPIHVNLIRVNEVAERDYKRGSRESVEKFIRTLEGNGVTATLRRRLGADIDAACGQLRRSHEKEQNG